VVDSAEGEGRFPDIDELIRKKITTEKWMNET
jgi:hypothetical protein